MSENERDFTMPLDEKGDEKPKVDVMKNGENENEEPSGVGDENKEEVPLDDSSVLEMASESEELPATDEVVPLDIVVEGMEGLNNRLADIEKLFEAKILRVAYEEKIVDQMHKDLQKYKEDLYAQLVRPILVDMIEIRDSILRISSAHLEKPEGEQSIPLRTFTMYASDVQELLEKNSVEIFKSEQMSAFTPIRQKAVKKMATDNPEHHGKVVESLSDGYSYNGRVISAEKVAIYSYEPPQTRGN